MGEEIGVCGHCGKVYDKYVGNRVEVEDGAFLEIKEIKSCPCCDWTREPGDDDKVCVAPKD